LDNVTGSGPGPILASAQIGLAPLGNRTGMDSLGAATAWPPPSDGRCPRSRR
jgi:hypothetical protein